MARFKDFIFCILLSFAYDSVEANTVSDIKETASLVWEGATGLYDIAKYLWTGVENSKILDLHSSDDKIDSPISKLTSDEKIQIDQNLKYLKAQSDYLMADIHAVKDVIKDKLVHKVAGLHDLNQGISEILTEVYKIDQSFSTFLDYAANLNAYSSDVVLKIATDVVSPGPCGMATRLTKIKALVIGSNKNLNIGNIVDVLVTHAELYIQYANIKQSQHQFLYNLLQTIVITELKAYLVINFSYFFIKYYTGKDSSSYIKLYDDDFKNRINDTIIAFKCAMRASSTEFYRGDPNKHIEDVTYTQLKNLFQTILLSAIDINRDDACYNNCDSSVYKKKDFNVECFDENEKLCKKQRPCTGDIVQCAYKIKNDMDICLPENSTSTRRYEYVIDGDGQRAGPNKKCDGEVITASAQRYLYKNWAVKGRSCDYCTCVCAEKKNSDRYFSLHEIQSRYSENYVITGVRFVKRNNIVHIQAQEGQLLPGGVINSSTVRWIPLPKTVNQIYEIKWNHKTIELHDLLDDANVEDNKVLIGVRLYGGKDTPLQLVTRPMLIDYHKGKVYTRSEFDDFPNYPEPSWTPAFPYTEFELPTRFIEKNTQNTKANTYSYFTLSGTKTDVGQSVVPFIDLQDIVTNPPTPLAGLGMYIRYVKNSGGFLALKLFTFNYEPYLNPNL